MTVADGSRGVPPSPASADRADHRPPSASASPSPAQRLLVGLVRAYRYWLSPWLGSQCRFEPTCSRYAIEALERHGALRGGGLAARRLARCHPFCPGGHDPVPPHLPASAGSARRGAGPSFPERSDPR